MTSIKLASSLFTAAGPDLVRALVDGGKRVFLDLKYHDIPNTVHGAVRSARGLGVTPTRELVPLRRALGPDPILVTPGIRPAGSEAGDQKRVATPAEATRAGSNYLVIGRPITQSADPVLSLQRIKAEIDDAMRDRAGVTV